MMLRDRRRLVGESCGSILVNRNEITKRSTLEKVSVVEEDLKGEGSVRPETFVIMKTPEAVLTEY
jgi:hypothetical protein